MWSRREEGQRFPSKRKCLLNWANWVVECQDILKLDFRGCKMHMRVKTSVSCITAPSLPGNLLPHCPLVVMFTVIVYHIQLGTSWKTSTHTSRSRTERRKMKEQTSNAFNKAERKARSCTFLDLPSFATWKVSIRCQSRLVHGGAAVTSMVVRYPAVMFVSTSLIAVVPAFEY